jgi:hypothetical protein
MKIKATGWWDNSPDNPANPDPAKNVTWGAELGRDVGRFL